MNRLSLARRAQVVNCLVEGNSIRSTKRMTDTRLDTIMHLMIEVGTGCAALPMTGCAISNATAFNATKSGRLCRMKQARIPRFTDRSKIGDECRRNETRRCTADPGKIREVCSPAVRAIKVRHEGTRAKDRNPLAAHPVRRTHPGA
jgi:hypothetical protein